MRESAGRRGLRLKAADNEVSLAPVRRNTTGKLGRVSAT